ncbi:MAG: FAD-dependent oxidoreductase [Gemmatimonadaceae bacterium]|nr:FAD-dependent oxidoreductase [Acetobacteraceae bacterium]
MTHKSDVDVAIIGAGQAAIPLARKLADAGRSVVLIERERLGGSCVNFGCTPTKAALASSRLVAHARAAAAFGVDIPEVRPDFAAVIARARGFADRARTALDAQWATLDNPCLIRGHARLGGRDGERFRVLVDGGPELRAAQVVLNTGTRSAMPPVPGLPALPVMNAENWLERHRLPARLIMMGSGPIGLELAQFYRRMGSDVVLLERNRHVAPKEDPDVAGVLHDAFEAEGVRIMTGVEAIHAERQGDGVRLHLKSGEVVDGSDVFVATGRRPNTDELGLDSVGLALGDGGVVAVDPRLATSVPGLWAVGDIRGGLQFTHTAWDDHRILLSQLLGDGARTTDRVVPYAVFTEPELGRVGLNEAEAGRLGIDHRVHRYGFDVIAKAKEEGDARGFIKILTDPGGDRLLGAAVLGKDGAELVHLFALLMHTGVGLRAIRDGIYAHPTLSEGLQSAVTAALA